MTETQSPTPPSPGLHRCVSFDPQCALIPEQIIQHRPRLSLRKYSLPLSRQAPTSYLYDPTFIPNPHPLKLSLPLPHFSISAAPPPHPRSRSTEPEAGNNKGAKRRSSSGSRDRACEIALVGCLKKERREKAIREEDSALLSDDDERPLPGVNGSGFSVAQTIPQRRSSTSALPDPPALLSTSPVTAEILTNGWHLPKPTLSTIKEPESGTATPPVAAHPGPTTIAESPEEEEEDPLEVMADRVPTSTSATTTTPARPILQRAPSSQSSIPGSPAPAPPSPTTASPARPGLRGRTSSLLSRVRSRDTGAGTNSSVPIAPTPHSPTSSHTGFSLMRTFSNSHSHSTPPPTLPHTPSEASTTPPLPQQDFLPLSPCCPGCEAAALKGRQPEWPIAFSRSAQRKIARDAETTGPGECPLLRDVRTGESLRGLYGVGVAGGAKNCLEGLCSSSSPKKESACHLQDETAARRTGLYEANEVATGHADDEDPISPELTDLIRKHVVIDEVERRRRSSDAGMDAEGDLERAGSPPEFQARNLTVDIPKSEIGDAWITSKPHSPSSEKRSDTLSTTALPPSPSKTHSPHISPSIPHSDLSLTAEELAAVDKLPSTAPTSSGAIKPRKNSVTSPTIPPSPKEDGKKDKFKWFSVGGAKGPGMPF